MEKERATRPSANFSYEPQLANTSTNMPQFVPINFDSNSLRPKSTNEQTQKVEPKQSKIVYAPSEIDHYIDRVD